ncbi:MAG TPA: filamentous hemagglutinin N-terminal domain-containing protein, partial [Gallionella sp.]|nr:filamentous hemagglutinin N-terminal domain-containing protein [Gallionella sp.]
MIFIQPNTGTAVTTTQTATNLTINQTSQTAVLNWQSFNIGQGGSVNFVQPNSNASALNKIWDANPSVINGSLTANGHIYLVNHNGIVFANGAQVNAEGLVASSLDISDALFQAGFLTNTRITPSFSGVGGFVRVDTGATLNGSRIMLFAPVVQNSGNIVTRDSAEGQTGQVVLAAGHKVYLEASSDPNLRGVLVEVDVTTPGAADPALNGQVATNQLGTVSNIGSVLAARGNITLAGYAVNQQGRLSATTSVTQNGSIKLLARHSVAPESLTTQNQYQNGKKGNPSYFDIRATQTGIVTLGAGSTTAVVPELNDTAATTDGQGFNPSIVEVMGNTINMQSGSTIVAPGGKVTLAAMSSIDPVVGTNGNSGTNVYQEISPDLAYSSFLNPYYKPAPVAGDTARVFLDSGSSIDVSGSTATMSVARNILTVELRGPQFQDAPLQRNGFLWGKKVKVDMRQGTPLANYLSDEALLQRNVAERTTTGGKVLLASTGDVVTKSGSSINLSGGQINYTPALIDSTALTSQGVVYDIATADPNRIYDGIVGTYTVKHVKWGITETFTTPGAPRTWDPGYVEGKAAGSVTFLAPHAALNGEVVANIVKGSNQRQVYADPAAAGKPVNYKSTWQMLPQGGSFVLGDSSAIKDVTTGISNFITDSDVNIQTAAAALPVQFAVADVLPASFLQTIVLDPGLFKANTRSGSYAVYGNKIVSLNAATNLDFSVGGALTLKADTLNIQGSVSAPAGVVNLSTALTPASLNQTAGAITIGSAGAPAVHISTQGQWTNDASETTAAGVPGMPDLTAPIALNGGAINIKSGSELLVAPGTLLDASGGAWMDARKKFHSGNGGAIHLSSGAPLANAAAYRTQLDGLDLRSYGVAGGKGGALTIKAGDVMLGGTGAAANILALSSGFFQRGGFASYSVDAQGFGGLTVAPGAVIAPQVQSLMLNPDAMSQVTGTDVYTLAKVAMLPDWQRVPGSVTLTQSNNTSGALVVGEGALVKVDPTASITLSAANQLTVLGTLDAPAGAIKLTLNVPSNSSFRKGNSTIWLGGKSQLLSRGTTLLTPNAQNLAQGRVLAGGSINISSNMMVLAQQGSLMDVSGSAAELDLMSDAGSYRKTRVAGDAGSIALTATEGALLDGAMKAGVAGGSAAAGKFDLTLVGMTAADRSILQVTAPDFPTVPWQIEAQAGGRGSFVTRAGLLPNDDVQAGKADLTAVDGKVYVDTQALQAAGFDQIRFKSSNGSINLADGVALQVRRSVTLDAPVISVAGSTTGYGVFSRTWLGAPVINVAGSTAGSKASITASYVNLANTDEKNQGVAAPQPGNGALNISAQMVDLTGNVSLSGINRLGIASTGDLRLNGVAERTTNTLQGTLRTQADMTLQAAQIYPSTLSQYKLSVEDATGAAVGNITVLPGATGPTPLLSAGGQLTLSAANIEQNGVVKAPLGTLNLNAAQNLTLAAGSVTSVSGEGMIVPFGLIQGGNAWKYDLNGAGNYATITVPPQKQIRLAGANINVARKAEVNLSGGGDLYAYEFFAGSGGSKDVLNPANFTTNTYAILPGLNAAFSPYDTQYLAAYQQPGGKAFQMGSTVYLAGGNGLAAGYYTLLPAQYALLPGAYTVTQQGSYQDWSPERGAISLLNGGQIMAGKFGVAGTGIADARWSGFAVTPGSVARTQSEYHDSYANNFFTAQAAAAGTLTPLLAADAGHLVVAANGAGATLALDGTFKAQHGVGGRGAQVDLSVTGAGFDIVNGVRTPNGLVQLDVNALNNIGAESLLIGGVRSQTETGTSITADANQVIVENAGSSLSGTEIMLAATDAVTVKAGSDIQAKGTYYGTSGVMALNGNGALLRVANAPQVAVTRTAANGATGVLTVENGAKLGAQNNSLLLDASQATSIGNSASLQGSAFSVSAQNIDVGNGTPAPATLNLSSELLAQIANFQDITLHSYNDLNVYGAATLGGMNAQGGYLIDRLQLDARSINGLNNAGLTNGIMARNIELRNTNGNAVTAALYGAGNLSLNADRIVLAEGDKSIQGFDRVELSARNEI